MTAASAAVGECGVSPLAGRASVSLYHLWRCHAALQVPTAASSAFKSTENHESGWATPPLHTQRHAKSHSASAAGAFFCWRRRTSFSGLDQLAQASSIRTATFWLLLGWLRNPPDSRAAAFQFGFNKGHTKSAEMFFTSGFTCEGSLCLSGPDETSGEITGRPGSVFW